MAFNHSLAEIRWIFWCVYICFCYEYIIVNMLMHGHGLKQRQFCSFCCSTEGQHLVALGAH